MIIDTGTFCVCGAIKEEKKEYGIEKHGKSNNKTIKTQMICHLFCITIKILKAESKDELLHIRWKMIEIDQKNMDKYIVEAEDKTDHGFG